MSRLPTTRRLVARRTTSCHACIRPGSSEPPNVQASACAGVSIRSLPGLKPFPLTMPVEVRFKSRGDDVADQDLPSISEVAEATGLQSSALRYYERQGLITPATRVSGRRHYDPSVLQRLAAIALLQEAGFTIAEVGQLLGPGTSQQRWREMADQKLAEM